MTLWQRGIEGTVIVQVQFDTDGGFKILGVVKSLGYGLGSQALMAILAQSRLCVQGLSIRLFIPMRTEEKLF